MSVLNASFLASLLFAIILGMDALDLIDLVALLERREFYFGSPLFENLEKRKLRLLIGNNLILRSIFYSPHFDVSLSKCLVF